MLKLLTFIQNSYFHNLDNIVKPTNITELDKNLLIYGLLTCLDKRKKVTIKLI